MTEAWIIDTARTPRGIGKVGKGALSEIHPQRLLSTVLKAAGALSARLQKRVKLETLPLRRTLIATGDRSTRSRPR